jgi:transcriptional regulator with PAS, ATPase and Fis domain
MSVTGISRSSSPGDLKPVIAAISAGLAQQDRARDLPGIFERELQRSLAIRSVRLREIPARYRARLVTPTRTSDSVVLGVPTGDPRVQAVLEACSGPERILGAADHETLAAAAQLGGLVLELARSRPARRGSDDGAAPLIGSSGVMRRLRDRIERVAFTGFTALIQGESGTGKELVAHQLHDLSPRAAGPFVAVNCAAVVETLLEAELFGIEDRTATGVKGRRGKFESADAGTLFLDEVSDLSLAAQAKLLRAIQEVAVERVGGTGERRVDTRIIVATNRPLVDLVAQGLFRADLYYRLGGVEIHVPALRERREDISELANYFLGRHRQTRDLLFSAPALEALRAYDWPGNVRELERLIESAVALTESESIELDDLPPRVRGEYAEVLGNSMTAGHSMRAWGSRYARLVFERCGRNKRRACRLLDISYHTLQAYLRYADTSASGSDKQLPAWVKSASQEPILEEAGVR